MYRTIILSAHLLIALFSTIQMQAQCSQPMDIQNFNLLKNNVLQNRSYRGYQMAMDAARTGCFTALQARDIAMALTTERDKYDFLSTVFPNITDKDNWTDVMDAFKSLALAFKLYQNTAPQNQSYTPQNPPQVSTPPILNGSRYNCATPTSDMKVNQTLALVSTLNDDRQKAKNILNLTLSGCITCQQAADLANTLQDENIRLDVLKRMFPNIYDVYNYPNLVQLLQNQSNRNNFNQYIQSLPQDNFLDRKTVVPYPPNPQTPLTPLTPQVPLTRQVSAMTDNELNTFCDAVKAQPFDEDKLSQIKTSLTNRSLTSVQIGKVVALSSFESTRLDIAEFLYDHCSDRQNYYLVNKSFKMSSTTNDLNEYIKAH